jgi:hypothetical protein
MPPRFDHLTGLMSRGTVLLATATLLTACDPSTLCNAREIETLVDTRGVVGDGERTEYTVTSPKNSNLRLTLRWGDPVASLRVRATLMACGVHTGCRIGDQVESRSTGSSLHELLVDGSQGKSWRFEVIGDQGTRQEFQLVVIYDTGICT